MRRILVMGGSGMLGHKLLQHFNDGFDVYSTFRGNRMHGSGLGWISEDRLIGNVSAQDFDSVIRAFAIAQPEFVINCVGIVKQDSAAKDPCQSISINALFPHRVAQLCSTSGAHLIQISTDCVFSGRKGYYTEADMPDPIDLYGHTKLLGEVTGGNCLSIRTSIIGRELSGSNGLIEWFLNQRGKKVKGFRKAVFNGFTTGVLAGIIAEIITGHADLSGLWHVAADPISKYDLLSLVREIYGLDIEIEPDDDFVCDRSLDGRRFRKKTGLVAPAWDEMIKDMSEDVTPYDEIRRIHAIG